MSTAACRRQATPHAVLPQLHSGDRLTQPEFHRRYEAYPDDVRIELVGGTVYVASPMRVHHSRYDGRLGMTLGRYAEETPGVEDLHGPTAILGEESEPQPDLGLRIESECGGRSRINADGYIEGPPELLAEIAHSTVALDMHAKRRDYQAAGVQEYLVLCIEEQELHWFHFKSRRTLTPDRDGIFRSRVFPGLWIDGPALLRLDSARLREVIKQGLASPEHAAFVKRLEAQRRKRSAK